MNPLPIGTICVIRCRPTGPFKSTEEKYNGTICTVIGPMRWESFFVGDGACHEVKLCDNLIASVARCALFPIAPPKGEETIPTQQREPELEPA